MSFGWIRLEKKTLAQTCVKIQSTFMLDLQQISLLLKFSTRKSLIIIDEFGKGTDLNGESNVFQEG